jgi:hypothetical protein
MTVSIKDVVILGVIVVVAALLFLAFLVTLRPSVVAAVPDDEVIFVSMKYTLAYWEGSSRGSR